MYDQALATMLAAASAYFRALKLEHGGQLAPDDPTGWVFPIPILRDGRRPVISDGWGSGRDGGARRHRGVDCMYKRKVRVSKEQARAEHGSVSYDVPPGTPVLAARAGKVWSYGHSEYGWNVILDHGKPWATFYQHLVEVSPAVRGGRGAPIAAGQALGPVGYGEKPGDGGIRHLHFAVWRGGGEEAAIDPEPMMASWQRLGPF